MMKEDINKYDKVLNMLRNSKPVLTDPEAISDRVIRLLREERSKVSFTELLIEFLFGWAYVGWVRRSMITVSMSIILIFGFQQAIILKRINDLSSQKIENGNSIMTSIEDEITSKMLIYRITGRKLSDDKLPVSKKEIDEMIKSVNKLQVKYKDVIDLIENDPQLKEYVENRMKELNKK
jgi:hypothetical protein